MPEIFANPGPFARQVSGNDPEGRQILSVITKRSYRYDSQGICRPHEEPVPLQDGFKDEPKTGELLFDSDLYPLKLRTDVVLHGKAGSSGPVRELTCAVRVGGAEKRIAVLGNRKCTLSSTGALIFSEPEQFQGMALSYANAYGGRDLAGHEAFGNSLAALAKYFEPQYDVSTFSLCDYPRNRAGKGYLCHWDPKSLEMLELPNLEDPLDRVSPTRLFAGNWDRWPAMPLPQGTGWVNHDWFPRIGHFGVLPAHDASFARIAEIALGHVPPDFMEQKAAGDRTTVLGAQGASLGLQFPPLRGDERIDLVNILPDVHSSIQLPGERPAMFVDGRNGRMLETRPVLHTLRIEPFFKRVSLVWRGHNFALRPYGTEELKTMPMHVTFPGF